MELFSEMDPVRLSTVMALDHTWATRLVTYATLIAVVTLWYVAAIGSALVCLVGFNGRAEVMTRTTVVGSLGGWGDYNSSGGGGNNATTGGGNFSGAFVTIVTARDAKGVVNDLNLMTPSDIIVLFATAAACLMLIASAVAGALRAHSHVVGQFAKVNLNARLLEGLLLSHAQGLLQPAVVASSSAAAEGAAAVAGGDYAGAPHPSLIGMHHQPGNNAVAVPPNAAVAAVEAGEERTPRAYSMGGQILNDDPEGLSMGDEEGRREGVFGSVTPEVFMRQFKLGEQAKGITLAGRDLCIDGELLIYTYDSEHSPKMAELSQRYGVVTASSGTNSPRAASIGAGLLLQGMASTASSAAFGGGGNNPPLVNASGKTIPPALIVRSPLQAIHHFTAIICLNKNGNITFWNHRMEALTGYRQMDIIGSSFFSLIVGGDRQTQAVRDAMEWTRNERKAANFSVDISSGRLMQRSSVAFDLAPFPAKSVDGTTEGILLVGNANIAEALRRVADELYNVEQEHTRQVSHNKQQLTSTLSLGGGGGGGGSLAGTLNNAANLTLNGTLSSTTNGHYQHHHGPLGHHDSHNASQITSPISTLAPAPAATTQPEAGDFAAVTFSFMGAGAAKPAAPPQLLHSPTVIDDPLTVEANGDDHHSDHHQHQQQQHNYNNYYSDTASIVSGAATLAPQQSIFDAANDLTLERISRVFAKLNDTIELIGGAPSNAADDSTSGGDFGAPASAPFSVPALVGRIVASTFSTRKINISVKQEILPVTTLDEERLSSLLIESLDHFTAHKKNSGVTLHIGYDVKRSGAIAFNFQPQTRGVYPPWVPSSHAVACMKKLRANLRVGFRGAVTIVFLSTASSEAMARAEQYQKEEKEEETRRASMAASNNLANGRGGGAVTRVTASSPGALTPHMAGGVPAEQIRMNIALLDANPVTNTLIRSQSWGRKHLLYFVDDLESLEASLDSVDVLFIRFPKVVSAAAASAMLGVGSGGNQQQMGGGGDAVPVTAEAVEKILGRLVVERTYMFVVLVEALSGNPTNLREVYGERVAMLQQPVTVQALGPAFAVSEEFVMKKRAKQRKTLETKELFMTSKTAPWTRGRQLGQGSFATVYEATNTVTKGKMAVRIIKIDRSPQGGSGDTEAIDKLIRDTINEIKLMASLEHKNIISYLYCEKDVGAINVFMEFAERGSLQGALKAGPASIEAASGWVRDILAGLEYLHDEGVVHLDLKAANVLLTADGTCKLADFGTARQFLSVGRRNSIAVKKKGPDGEEGESAGGTLHFMSPEVLAGEPPTWQADIWSLGCLVMELLTAKLPHSHVVDGPLAVIQYISRLRPGDVPLIPATITNPDAIAFIRMCLRVDPEQRPSVQTLMVHPFILGYALKHNALHQPKPMGGSGNAGVAVSRRMTRGAGGSVSDDSSNPQDRRESCFNVWEGRPQK